MKKYEEPKSNDIYKGEPIILEGEEANIKSTRINSFNLINNKIVIQVELISRYKDYFINENGYFVSGINDHRIETIHNLTFEKDINAIDAGIITTCPNCGNSINANENGVCGFCNKVVNMETYEYILTEINTFKN